MSAYPTEIGGQLDRDLDLPASLHALVFLDEGDEVTVGRPDIDSYCVLPADGAALLRELQRGISPRRASDWYTERYGESVDIAEFLAAMDELGFLLGPDSLATASRPLPWQRLGKLAFSPPAWLGYLALLVAGALVMARHPDLLPRTHHLFFTQYTTGVMLLGIFGQFPFVLLHEAFHALAGRRLGLNSRLRIGRRLYFLVAETTLDGLVVVPRRKRYLPILSGMLADLLSISILTLIAAAVRHPDGSQPLAGRICLALAFATLLRFVWQFYLYLQTDLYQLVVTVLGCVDLQRTTRRLIVNRVNRLLGRKHRLHDESLWHPRDRAVANWYCWLLLGGYLVSIGSLVLAIVPLLHRLFGTAYDRLTSGHGVSAGAITDSVIFLLVTLAQLAVAAVMMLRERRQRRMSPAVHVID